MAFEIEQINIKPFPETLDLSDNEAIDTIMYNGQIFNELTEFLRTNRDSPLSKNFWLQAKVACNTVYASLKAIIAELQKPDYDEEILSKKYDFMLTNYKKIDDKINIAESLNEWIASNRLLEEMGFLIVDSLVIWTASSLVWQHWVFMMALDIQKQNSVNLINLTCKEGVNAFHIYSNGSFCSWNTFNRLMPLLKNNDFTGFFNAIGSVISWYDDRAHHLANINDFAEWKKIFDYLIGWKRRDDLKDAYKYCIKKIPLKWKQFISNISSFKMLPLDAKKKKQVIDYVNTKCEELVEDLTEQMNSL